MYSGLLHSPPEDSPNMDQGAVHTTPRDTRLYWDKQPLGSQAEGETSQRPARSFLPFAKSRSCLHGRSTVRAEWRQVRCSFRLAPQRPRTHACTHAPMHARRGQRLCARSHLAQGGQAPFRRWARAVWEAAGRGRRRHAPSVVAAAAAGPSAASRAARGLGGPGRGLGRAGCGPRHCPAGGSRRRGAGAGSRRPGRRPAPRPPGGRGAQATGAACTRPARARAAAATQEPPPPTTTTTTTLQAVRNP